MDRELRNWIIAMGLILLVLVGILWYALFGITPPKQTTHWIQIDDYEIDRCQRKGYAITCDSREYKFPRQWNCYAIPKEEVGP